MSEQREAIENAIWDAVDEGTFDHSVNAANVVSAITDAIAALPPGPVGWRDMDHPDLEQIKKDRTQILVWSPERCTCVTWYDQQYDKQPKGWIDWYNSHDNGGNYYTFPRAWMPLPAAPGQPEQPSVAETFELEPLTSFNLGMCDCQSYNLPETTGIVPEVILDHAKYFPDTGRPTVCVDACIADVIEGLWKAGVSTRGCCCGHNDRPPSVILGDHKHFLAASYLLMKDGRPWRVYVDLPDLRSMAENSP